MRTDKSAAIHPGAPSPAQEKRVIVGTAGHIDHGKTALVYALTGTNTDRLPEEKQRGITIDLGFADLRLPAPGGGSLNLSLIDVPGHHAFVHTMLAGTGGIDCVLLVVAADEGVKPQTVEHLAICRLLGIHRGIVALTKIDAATPAQVEATRQSVSALVANTFLRDAPVLEVSAVRGDGIAQLKSRLAAAAAQIAERSHDQLPRVPLDRAFSVRGFGTVVTGTLQAGSIRVGEMLQQVPGERVLRVRGLQVHGHSVQQAQAPCRVALNLADLEVAQAHRGDTLIPPHTLAPCRTVDVAIELLPGAEDLKHGARVRVHAFTASSPARVLLFDRNTITSQQPGFARLKLARPLLLFPGDRIVLRRPSPAATVGGALVLDAAVPPRIRKVDALDWLKRLASADSEEQVRLRAARRGREGISLESLVAETGLAEKAVSARTQKLVSAGALIPCRETPGTATHWIVAEALRTCLADAQRELENGGSLSRAVLRSRARLNSEVFAVVLHELSSSGKYRVSGEMIQSAGAADSVPERLRTLAKALEDVYRRAGLAWPRLQDISSATSASAPGLREAITLLLREKKLVRMGADDAFVHTDALQKLYADLRRHRGETFDVARFKSLTGLTRKHAIPLLEHLDQARVTRKSGEARIVL